MFDIKCILQRRFCDFVIVFFEHKQFFFKVHKKNGRECPSSKTILLNYLKICFVLTLFATSIKLTTTMMIKFHFQRFKFVLQLWLILLTLLVCFGSNQCPLTTSECNATFALQTSFNLPTSITDNGTNQTNPCSKKTKQRKENTYPTKEKKPLQTK